MTFSSAYITLLAQYFVVSGLSLCIALWWGTRAIRAWREGRFRVSHQLMSGFALVAFGNGINCLIRLPDHYYRGIGLHELARAWLRDWHMLTTVAAGFVVIGYLVCVLSVPMTQPGGKPLFWLLGCGAYLSIGVLAWWYIGGFAFEYR